MKNVQKVALTGGIVWGATLFLTTLMSVYWGQGTDFLKGYIISLGGSLVGLVYGFWLYMLVFI